jgi:hypothetical protein
MYNHLWEVFPGYFGSTGQVIYKSLSRALFSLAMCCFIFACHVYQTGSIIRWFLSLNFWQPLSKVGLCIYIVHGFYLSATNANLPQKSAFGMWWSFMIHMNDFMASIVIGTFLYLLVEAPTVKVLAYFWSKQSNFQFNIKRKDTFSLKMETLPLMHDK